MDVAVRNDLGAGVHHGHHHQITSSRIDLLAGAQRLVDDQGGKLRACQWGLCRRYWRALVDGLLRGGGGFDRCRVGRADQAGRQRGGSLLRSAAFEGQGRQPVETQQGDQGHEIGAGRIGGQGAQINHQRIVVKKIRDIAVLAGQFGREGVQIGGLQAQCHQRKIRALDLERGRRVSCNGNGHGGWNARRKRARILPVGPAAPAGKTRSPAIRPLPLPSIQGICFDPVVENWIFSLKNKNLKLKSSCASGVEIAHRVATRRLGNGGLVNYLCTADPQLVVYSGWVTSRKSGSSG